MVKSANQRSAAFYVGVCSWVVICIQLLFWDLGILAFCGSVFLGMFAFGFRDKFSNEETASAYSVFNKDGKAIVGGFTAQQFDSQLRGGPRHSKDDPVQGPVAVAAGASQQGTSTVTMSSKDRLRRRQAAAAAAESRLQQTRQAQDQ